MIKIQFVNEHFLPTNKYYILSQMSYIYTNIDYKTYKKTKRLKHIQQNI